MSGLVCGGGVLDDLVGGTGQLDQLAADAASLATSLPTLIASLPSDFSAVAGELETAKGVVHDANLHLGDIHTAIEEIEGGATTFLYSSPLVSIQDDLNADFQAIKRPLATKTQVLNQALSDVAGQQFGGRVGHRQ